MGTMTLCTMPLHSTPLEPTATRVAPTRPPISACDELEGMPKYQVIRFQAMAPARAASTTVCESVGSVTRPLPTVFATFWPAKAPSMLKAAAMSSATRGDSARVEIEQAMALAESWKPLVKSKARATAMMATSSSIRCS